MERNLDTVFDNLELAYSIVVAEAVAVVVVVVAYMGSYTGVLGCNSGYQEVGAFGRDMDRDKGKALL